MADPRTSAGRLGPGFGADWAGRGALFLWSHNFVRSPPLSGKKPCIFGPWLKTERDKSLQCLCQRMSFLNHARLVTRCWLRLQSQNSTRAFSGDFDIIANIDAKTEQGAMGFLRLAVGFRPFLGSPLPVILLMTVTVCGSCQSTLHKPTEAQVKIIGGEDAGENFPAVQVIISGEGLCSGTFIDTSHFLTAAHCLRSENGETQELSKIKLVTNSEQPVQVDIHARYGSPPRIDRDYDVAIVTFKLNTDRLFAIISRISPRLGDWVTPVGFGAATRLGFNPIPRKKMGKNQISKFIGKKVFIENHSNRKMSDRVLLGPGDSGGGWFDSRNELVAVGSSGNTTESQAVLINDPPIREFIREVLNRPITSD